MIVGMDRVPTPLYVPIDGEWARWNVEATLQFGKIFDLLTRQQYRRHPEP
jgi:hypothetical protein